MVLEIPTTKAQISPSNSFSSTGCIHTGAKAEEGHRESRIPFLAISPVHRSEAGPSGESPNPGFIATESIHKLPNIQDANHPRRQVSPATGILDHLHRLQGRLLARASSTEQASVSGFPISKPGLPIPCNAFWPLHGTKGVHQSGILRGETTRQRGNFRVTLPRRLVTTGANEGRMSSNTPESSRNHQEFGLHCKRKEIKAYTGSRVQMVRRTMESSIVHSSSGRTEISVSTRRSHRGHQITPHHKTFDNEAPGPERLDRQERSQRSPPQDNDENYSEDQTKIRTSGYTLRSSKSPKITTLCLGQHSSNSSVPGLTSTRPDNPDGCLSEGLGIPDKSVVIQRDFRPINEAPLNQRHGTTNYLVCTPHSATKEYCNTGTLRQLFSNTRAKKGGIHEIRTIFPSGVDMEQSDSVQLDTQHISHRRILQRHSGSVIQKHSPVNRMVSHGTRFSESSHTQSSTGSGSVCNKAKQKTSSLCITMSGPTGRSSECTDDAMGQVETPLHVSPDTYTFEGFMSTDPVLLHKRNTHYPGNAHETVVHDSPTSEDPIVPSRSQTPTSSSGQDSETTQYYQTSRVAVIREAYQSKFKACQETLGLLATPLRQSSLNDYETKWKIFCSFLSERNISPKDLTLSHVLDFFSFLFYEKKLKPTTVAHYRSAITVPLQLGFQINLHDTAVSHLLRAMSIKRPNAPATAPKWCLDKMLKFLDSWPIQLPLDRLLQKTAFLLLLATGWRISELHACVRSPNYCSISIQNTLSLRPHPSFLAKNECTINRWTHNTILPLLLPDGTRSKLCPVAALAEYLNKTSRITTGSLFLHPSTQKPLTKGQLGTYICKLILNANPSKSVKVHDIRKYAASYSLARSFNLSDMVHSLRWKSPHTFFKFYMSPTAPLSVNASLPQDPRGPTTYIRTTSNTEEFVSVQSF